MASSSTLSVAASVLSGYVSDCAAGRAALVASVSRQNETRNAIEPRTPGRDTLRAITKMPGTDVPVPGACRLGILYRLTPGCAADIRLVPPRVRQVQAVDVALAFRVRVAILEPPVQQRARVRILGNGRLPNRSFAVVHDVLGAAPRWRLAGTGPGQHAVRVACGLPVLVARRDAVVVGAQVDHELARRPVGAPEWHGELAR